MGTLAKPTQTKAAPAKSTPVYTPPKPVYTPPKPVYTPPKPVATYAPPQQKVTMPSGFSQNIPFSSAAAQTKARVNTWKPDPNPPPVSQPRTTGWFPGASGSAPTGPITGTPLSTAQRAAAATGPKPSTAGATAAGGPKPSAWYPGAPLPASMTGTQQQQPPAAAPAVAPKTPAAAPGRVTSGGGLNTGNSNNINGGAYLEGVGKKGVDSEGEAYEIKLAHDAHGNPFTYKETASNSLNGTRPVVGLSERGTILQSVTLNNGTVHIYDTGRWPNGKPTNAPIIGKPTQGHQPVSTPVPSQPTQEEIIEQQQGGWLA